MPGSGFGLLPQTRVAVSETLERPRRSERNGTGNFFGNGLYDVIGFRRRGAYYGHTVLDGDDSGF